MHMTCTRYAPGVHQVCTRCAPGVHAPAEAGQHEGHTVQRSGAAKEPVRRHARRIGQQRQPCSRAPALARAALARAYAARVARADRGSSGGHNGRWPVLFHESHTPLNLRRSERRQRLRGLG